MQRQYRKQFTKSSFHVIFRQTTRLVILKYYTKNEEILNGKLPFLRSER